MNVNEIRKSRRRYVLVQLPEPTGRDEYQTIADIAKRERMDMVSLLLSFVPFLRCKYFNINHLNAREVEPLYFLRLVPSTLLDSTYPPGSTRDYH